jgi:hypothetical protein
MMVCAHCKTGSILNRPNQRYCSADCRQKAYCARKTAELKLARQAVSPDVHRERSMMKASEKLELILANAEFLRSHGSSVSAQMYESGIIQALGFLHR